MTLDVTDPPHATDEIDAILTRCRQMVGPALRQAIDQLHPWPGHMAAFTLGWCETDGTPRKAHAGKGLRPAIAMLCGRAAGASPEAAVSGAVAVELVHAFSLVHDDIMDGDERRRHRQTVWKAYGIGPAVLTGDALLALAFDTLTQSETGRVGEAMGQVSSTLIELVHGQAEDLMFEERPWSGPEAVTVEEYHAMAARKTGALYGCAAAVGALLGGGSSGLADTMADMGRHLGLAFQAVDDLLGVWGDPEVTGKPIFNDLRQRKKTLPVVAALSASTGAASRLLEILESGPADEPALRRSAALIEEIGGGTITREHAEHHLGQALRIIRSADLEPAAAEELAALSRFVVNRSH
jgi:geranylgeranyl diphosphate synthase, type I